MDTKANPEGLEYEAEYYRLKDGISKQKAENEHLFEELQEKEKYCSITMVLKRLAN